ncbi:MAG: nucleoside-diphosphate kinase [Rhizobiaceae bacterium]
MSNKSCILTTKDFTTLETMLGRCLGRDDALAPLLREKLESALVVIGEYVPANIATLGSRVTFRVDGQSSDTRVLSNDRMTSPVGLFLPIATPRGLALLGLKEGDTLLLSNRDGVEERIVLEKVHYQPEAAKREKEAMRRLATPVGRKPLLRLIRGAFFDSPEHATVRPEGLDDPGPSAA